MTDDLRVDFSSLNPPPVTGGGSSLDGERPSARARTRPFEDDEELVRDQQPRSQPCPYPPGSPPTVPMPGLHDVMDSLRQVGTVLQQLSDRMDRLEQNQQAGTHQQATQPANQQHPGVCHQAGVNSQIPPMPRPAGPLGCGYTGVGSSLGPVGGPLGVGVTPSAGRSMDTKWIPSMPMPCVKEWSSRMKEISGFRGWAEAFSSWLSLLHERYGEELREAINKVSEIRIDMMVDADQHLRSQRLLHLLEQAFHNYPRVENLVRQYVLRVGQGCACGFEVFRLLRQEFSVQTRNEAMSYRNKVLEWSSSSRSNLLDIVRMFEVEVMQFHGMLDSTANPHLMSDLRIRDADLYLVLMRNLPERVQLHCQLHAGQTFLDLRQCVEDYHHRTRIVSDHGKLAKLDVDRKGKGGKDGNKGGKDGNKGSGKDGKGGYGQESGKGKKGKEGKSESKGKGKGGGHEKGQGDARQRSPAGSPASSSKKGPCWFCGKPGHVAAECWKKKEKKSDKTRSVEGSDSENGDCGESSGYAEPLMVIHSSITSTESNSSGNSSRIQAGNSGACTRAGAASRVAVSPEQLLRVNASQGVRWLVDSGATCHAVSRKMLKKFTVLKHYRGVNASLVSASGNEIPTHGVVDLRVEFGGRDFVLSFVVVAEMPFNVISSWALATKGWVTVLAETDEGSKLVCEKAQCEIGLQVEDRSWWAVCSSVVDRPSRSGKAKAVPMEVDACVAEFLEQMSMLESQDAGEVSVRLATAEEVEQVSKRIPKSVEKADVSSSKRIPKSAEKANVSFSSPKVQTFRPSSGSMGSYSYLVRVVESEAVFAAPVSGVSGIEVSVDCQGSVFEREHGSRADMVGGWLWDLSPCGSLELELESVEPAYAVQLKRCVSGWLFVLWMWFVLLKSCALFWYLEMLGCRWHVRVSLFSLIPHAFRAPYGVRRAAFGFGMRGDSVLSVTVVGHGHETQWMIWVPVYLGFRPLLCRSAVKRMGTEDVDDAARSGPHFRHHRGLKTDILNISAVFEVLMQLQSCHEIRLDREPGSGSLVCERVDMIRGLPKVVDVEAEGEGVREREPFDPFADDPLDGEYTPTEAPGSPEGSRDKDLDVPIDVEMSEQSEFEPELVSPQLEESVAAYARHCSTGHWPYSRDCKSCCKARGRMPARRREKEEQFSVGVDFLFFGNKIRVFLAVVVSTHMMFAHVMRPSYHRNVSAISAGMAEIGATGQEIEWVGDQEDLLEKLLRDVAKYQTFPGIGAHWRHAPVGRKQGLVERYVCIFKEGVFSIWMSMEDMLGCRVALESDLFKLCVQYAARTHNIHNTTRCSSATPLDRMRNSSEAPKPSTYPFGCLGNAVPKNKDDPRFRGQRLVPIVYFGPLRSTGAGTLGMCLERFDDAPKVEEFGKFRMQVGEQGNPFVMSREALEPVAIPRAQVAPPVEDYPSQPPAPAGLLKRRREEGSSVEPEPVTVEPVVAAPDVEMGASNVPSEIGDERMELDMLIVNWHEAEREKFLLRNFDGMPSVSKASCYKVVETSFCGLKVEVPIPHDLRDENTGDALSPEEVYAAVRVELDSLTALRVGKGILEKEAQRVAKEAGIRILSSRWVLTQKSEGLARARLVVKDFRTYGKTPVLEGIYSPTGSIEGLRIMLAFGEYTACFYGTLDVSTAFMFANLPQDSLVLVRMPPSILSRNQRVTLVLWKAMNGLREGPLRWYTELTSGLEKDGFQATAEVTLWRRQEGDGSVTSVLIYVDDLLVSNPSKERVENVMVVLEGKYKVKRTGWLSQENPGQLKFLGRLLTREWAYGPLTLGLSEEYVDEILHVWNERLKPTESLPKLEDLLKSEEKKEHAPLTAAAVERYRKVLGMLAWASVSRCDLLFVVGFLSRGQSSPTGPYESCLRAVLKWIMTRRAVVQTFPASAPPSTVLEGEDVLIGYCDASWNNPSVSGGGISWNGHCLKMWSRKQSVPALSSAEAELASMVECLKELMHVGIVLQTLRQGIVYDAQGAPEKTTHDMKMVLHCDSTAANSISGMIGLLRKIRHVELRAAFLQYCVRIRKVKVVFYEGALQPVDGLTKTPSAVMLKHLGDFVGLEIVRSLLNTPEPECDSWMEEDMFVIRVHRVPRSDLFVPDELSEPPVALGRIGKIRETVCVFVDGGSPIVIRDEWRESTFQLDSGMKRMWTGETRFELLECIDALADSVSNAANQKTVTFEMSPISPEPGTQDSLGKESLFMVSFRESMEKVQEWKKSVDMLFGPNLPKLVFVEVCCAKMSSVQKVCDRRNQEGDSICYFGIHSETNLTWKQTQCVLAHVLKFCKRKRLPVRIHFSTPCTSGSPYIFLNSARNSGYKKRLKKLQRVHRDIWKICNSLFGPFAGLRTFTFSQEWPKHTLLWKDPIYVRNASVFGMSFEEQVDRCAFDKVFHRWKFMCSTDIGEDLGGFFCMHGPQDHLKMDVTSKGFYPIGLARQLVQSAWRAVEG